MRLSLVIPRHAHVLKTCGVSPVSRCLVISLLIALVSSITSKAQTNLLNDPSFEQTQITANSRQQDPSGTGWIFSGNAGLINGVVSGTAAYTSLTAVDGNQFAYLQTNRSNARTDTDGQITQTVTIPSSGNYTLSLWSALRDSNSASFNTTWTTYYMVRIDGTVQNSSTEVDVGGDQHAISDVQFNETFLTFYMTAGTHTLTLVSGGPTSGNTTTFIDNVQLNAANTLPMSQVAVTSVQQSMETNVPSEPFNIQLNDSNGLPVDAPSGGTTLNLRSSSSGGTFMLTGSGSAITSITIPAGSHTGTFYYQDSNAGTPVVTISGSGLTSGTQSEMVASPSSVALVRQSGTAVLSGSGTVLTLNGANLGGWLIMEGYMAPIDGEAGSPTQISDQYTAMAVLDSRFGRDTEQQLFRTYQSTWITDADLQNAHNAGFNVLRVPFWWGNLYTTDFQWRPDAFQYLDWVVQDAAKYGLYVILDLHGVFGSQTNNLYSGTANLNRFWENAYYQNKTNELWQRVATHYKYNNNVLAYDMVNEPDGSPDGNDAIAEIQNNLYTAIRQVDPGHMIIMEETGGSWNSAQLPNPSVGGSSSEVTTWQNVPNAPAIVQQPWTNVAYSFHSYPPYDATLAQSQSEINSQNSNFNTVHGYGVPDIIGEANYYQVEQSWYNAFNDFKSKGINTVFWALKGEAGAGEDSWALYDENGWAWGDPEGWDGAGNYPNGDIGALYTPNLMADDAQTIANDWAAFTTSGSMNAQPGTYPNTPTYQPNFHHNFALGDPITEVLQPQTAIAEGLLPPTTPPPNGVQGVNYGFENPYVSNDEGGGDSPDYRTNYNYNPQTVSAGWTFSANSGITNTGLQTGGLTGWTHNGTEIVAPEGQQVGFLGQSSTISQVLTSGNAGVWTITYSGAQRPGGTQTVYVAVDGTAVTGVTTPSGNTFHDYTVTTGTLAAGSHTLAFTSSSSGAIAFIDDVRVTVGSVTAAPSVDTTGTVSMQLGLQFYDTIAATNQPTSYNATGLPAGLTVNGTNGVISGKPTATGTSVVTLSAANASGTGTQTLTLVVTPLQPYLAYSASGSTTEGTSYGFGISSSQGTPTSYEAYDMPAGLTIDTSTGRISGTTMMSGTFTVLLVATNAGGTAEEQLTLTVAPTKPVITSGSTATGSTMEAFYYAIEANYQPTSFAATGLPGGLSLNPSTGVISGTPSATGTTSVALSAINASGTGTGTVTITVNNPVPLTPMGLTAFPWDKQVDMQWNASTFATGYNVLRATTSGGSYTQVATNLTTPYYTDKAVTDGSNYYYEIVATNSYGSSSATNPVMATPNTMGVTAWESGDIGAVGLTGSSSYVSGTYTVVGGGQDIQGTADAFQFVSQSMTGDGAIVARVDSQTNTSSWAKAGVMMRDTLAAGSANACILVTPSQGITWQWRSTAGGSTSWGRTTGVAAPYWVKMARTGNVFTSYYSPDGVTWTQGNSQTVTMGSTIYVGLAVTAQNNSALCTATMDSVDITPTQAWTSSDIGSVGTPGFSAFTSGTLTTQVASSDIWGSADAMHFVYQPANGDCQITAQVTGVENTNSYAKVGVMIRETLAANSDNVSLLSQPRAGLAMQVRSSAGASTGNVAINTTLNPPYWLRLNRTGNTFTAYASPDDVNWTTLGSTTVTMGTNAYIGIPFTTHNGSAFGSATVTGITVTQ